jgi:putative sigma-54 modulation protein
MRSEEEDHTFYIALDSAIDKLKRQLKKLKTKRLDKSREHPGIAEVVNSDLERENRSEIRSVMVKRFTLKPMSVDEAIMQLDMSGHDFFLFVNHDETINCVYKRSDGGLGLLVPETAAIE